MPLDYQLDEVRQSGRVGGEQLAAGGEHPILEGTGAAVEDGDRDVVFVQGCGDEAQELRFLVEGGHGLRPEDERQVDVAERRLERGAIRAVEVGGDDPRQRPQLRHQRSEMELDVDRPAVVVEPSHSRHRGDGSVCDQPTMDCRSRRASACGGVGFVHSFL